MSEASTRFCHQSNETSFKRYVLILSVLWVIFLAHIAVLPAMLKAVTLKALTVCHFENSGDSVLGQLSCFS